MAVKFTEQTIKKLSVPVGSRDQQWFDSETPGFGIRKFRSGHAIFFIKFKAEGKQKKQIIGPYEPGNLSVMRNNASELLIDLRRKARETRSIKEINLDTAIKFYLDARKDELGADWYVEVRRYLEQIWAELHHRPLRELNRGELVRKLDAIAQERGARTADHSQRSLSALFSWAIDRGYADANPLTRLKRRVKTNGRTRTLDLQELVSIWQSIGNDDFGSIVRLLALTLQRKSEIGDLEWREVDLSEDPQIDLPEERTKNGLAHAVPLSNPAAEILRTRMRKHGRDFVFGDGQRGFQGWSKAKRRLELAACKIRAPELMNGANSPAASIGRTKRPTDTDAVWHSIIPHWTLHDLRRTGATMMNEFGLAEPHIIEAVLNHISGASKGGVAGIYNRARYDAQKRAALERWAGFLTEAIEAYRTDGFEGVAAFERREKQKLRGVFSKTAETEETAVSVK